MPPSQTFAPLHLFRYLLREATYLPRPCATYVHHQITTRFKKHMKDDPKDPLTKRRLHKAHNSLRSLHAANAGVLMSMKRILYLTFGQHGRRRRTLIAQNFLKDEATTNKQARDPAALPKSLRQLPTHHRGEPLESDWLDNWDLPKLTALAASQARQEFATKSRLKGNKLEPKADDIPAENALGRPLGAKAARRHVRKWYKALINKINAPLPRDEWEALGRLALGEDGPWEKGPPARRPLCGGETTEDKKKKAWDWKVYAVEPVRSIERGQSRKFKARTGEQGEGPYGLGRAIGVHRYDCARFWRRLYMLVWRATPTMEAVPGSDGGKWKIEWGKEEMKEVPMATPAQMAFFEGELEGAGGKGGRGIKSKQKKKLGLTGEDMA